MNNLNKTLFTFAIASTMVFSSCSKYEDGPGLSLRSAKARLAGEWKNVKYTENGVDQTLSSDDKDDVWKFEKGGDFELQDPGNSTEKGTWDFNSDKDKLILTIDGSSISFDILRLANKEMVLQLVDDSDKAVYTFEQ